MMNFLAMELAEETFARFIMFHCGLPLVGKFFVGLENKFILRNVMNGGFENSTNLTDGFLNC